MATPPPNEAVKLAILRQQLMDKIKQDAQYTQTTDRQYTGAIQPNPNWTPTKAKGGLAKFLEPSVVKNRVYHGTESKDDYDDDNQGNDAIKSFAGRATWVAEEPYTAHGYSGKSGYVMPLHVKLKKPLKIDHVDANDEAHHIYGLAKGIGVDVDHLKSMSDPESVWEVINHPYFIDAASNAGFDGISIKEGGRKTHAIFNPAHIKSAIGNRGTYDTTKADITKAKGGQISQDAMRLALLNKGKGGSVLKELEAHLKQREGDYGVKRLQRAADEIPNLESMYDLQALKSAFGGDNAQALMTMNPADFEKFALRLGSEEDESSYEGGMTRDQYLNQLLRIAKSKGFRDVPFLEVGRRKPEYLPNVAGHEGRHRSRALTKGGEQKSLVRLFPTPGMREGMPRRYREDFIEAMKKELGEKRLVTPEGRSLLPADLTAQEHRNLENRNLVAANRPQLPEIYKDGGKVTHAHQLDIEERPL